MVSAGDLMSWSRLTVLEKKRGRGIKRKRGHKGHDFMVTLAIIMLVE